MKTGIIPMTQSGAIQGRPGQYKSPPFLMMPDVEIQNVTLHELKANKIPEPEDINNIPEDYGKELVEVSQRTVGAYAFYCDSVEWDDSVMWGNASYDEKRAWLDTINKNGDGTKKNPWRNVCYALQQLQCFAENTCCQYFVLFVSGVVNYTICYREIVNPSNYDWRNHLIMDGQNADFQMSGRESELRLFSTLKNVIFKNWDVSAVSNNTLYGFYNCHGFFEKCNISVTSINERAFAFHGGNYSAFYQCTGYSDAQKEYTGGWGTMFAYCFQSHNYCIFYQCNTQTLVNGVNRGISFSDSSECIYYQCEASCDSYSINSNCRLFGFWNITSASLYSCKLLIGKEAQPIECSGIKGFTLVSSFLYHCEVFLKGYADYNQTSTAFDLWQSRAYHCKAYDVDTGFNDNDNSLLYYCSVSVNEHTSEKEDVEHIGFSKGNLYNCECNMSSVVEASSAYATVRLYGFQNPESYYNCNISLSGTASATPYENGKFYETEEICGFYDSSGCHDPCHHVYRTKGGTTDYCNS